jgi:endonuclease/exonuclease/phosphatase (EEP) superfamily protein YafD
LEFTGARRAWLIWILVVPIVLWALVRLFGLEKGSLPVALMAFTPYAAVAAFLLAGVAVALSNWAAAVVTMLATVCLVAGILPRAIGGERTPVDGHEALMLLSANVHHGAADPAALLGLVEGLRPDLLSIQELTPGFANKLRALGIERWLPYGIVSPRAGWAGLGVYSRLPLRSLPEGRRNEGVLPRVEAELPSGRSLRIVDVHPHSPVSGPEARWRGVLEGLPSAGTGEPWVLAGDFNATLDHAVLRDVVDRGYRDAGDVTGKGLEPTWPSGLTVPPLIAIDHVLADRRLGVAEYGVENLPGSDHRAIYARLVMP